MAGEVRQNANAVKITKRTLKPHKATQTTKQSPQASVIQDAYPQTQAPQDAYTSHLRLGRR
ncbi:hypothetical protein JG687_00014858 [Phytophthora cactorum]|uniref:Uncharacterized protein n=1 Tax=Phytophthora cactorum TaxID=29920 RepID=A0A329RHA0_9STRA|nr:hypothetical protein Pcac1_g15254 [Phytophthora cactorum]KAG2808623.1 hypothetical protein PC111_g16406 [Phytophthora cactorum]KAG2820110.1 hypothetical protein PC112_g11910 [Phytophthora cactorum]KAG2833944.1 hypothetical protein PC113_g20487 [Phytophthora cactorum]KAG2887912.1 hypothetical protein PC115_g20200 [Phytophthora cactorum]